MPKLSRRRLLAASVPALGGAAAALHSAIPHSHPWEHEAQAAEPAGHGRSRAAAGTRASATAAPSTTPPTASTRTRSCATSTGARRRAGRAAASLREWELVAVDKEIEVAPGVKFAAWTYNGRIPGPTLRCREGDRLRITFANGSAHPHTIHFHGIHPAEMDGVPGLGRRARSRPAARTVYEFDALPAGLHLYHCHVRPLAEHIAKGLYGAFIVDPKDGARGRRRGRDGDERVRHELRPRERGLRRQHDRLRLHGQADRRQARTSSSASTSSTCSSTT